jgi:hypothetical protein
VFWFLRKKLANDVKGKEYALNDLPAYTETSTKYAHVVGESPVRTEVDAHTPPTELPPVPMDPQELYGDERRR